MNAVLAADGAACSRPWSGAGPVPADSGLRLLIGGASRQQLRWSPDPDAPASRPLGDGELRLAIRWVELSAHDLARPATRAQPETRRGRVDWSPVGAIGCAEVVESAPGGPSPGRWLLGPLHVGTHRVLHMLSHDADGCIAAQATDAQPPRQQRYAWIPALQPRIDVAGPDAVERAVHALRERSPRGENRVRLSLCAAISATHLQAPG